jgi:SAM-dependent methyltransferase
VSDEQQVIDVERLVEDVRERVARDRSQHVGSGQQLIAPEVHRIELRPETIVSNKRVVGPLITFVRRVVLRVLALPLQDLVNQMNTAVAGVQQAIRHEGEVRQGMIEREAAAREAAQRDYYAVKKRFDGLDTALNALELAQRLGIADEAAARGEALRAEADARERISQRLDEVANAFAGLHVATRLAKLERARREPARATQPAPTTDGGGNGFAGLDYVAFEERFRPEQIVRERQARYVEILQGRRRVVDLGCGRGELLELLEEADVSAYGVDIDPDVIALAGERGVEVLEGDAVAHLRSLDAGAVDAIVASHVVEHLPAAALVELVERATEVLPPDGVLILETPNPESLLAGSVNFHRDPTHERPVHPDTLSFVCELAGFSRVEVMRLAPVPDEDRLPAPAPPDGRLATYLDAVVEQLNELLYGNQDYAVIARP